MVVDGWRLGRGECLVLGQVSGVSSSLHCLLRACWSKGKRQCGLMHLCHCERKVVRACSPVRVSKALQTLENVPSPMAFRSWYRSPTCTP